MPLDQTLFMEAAMCLWEAFLEHEDKQPLLNAYRAEVGTVQVRHDIMTVVEPCIAEWDAMTDDEREAYTPYDWNWCEHFLLNRVEWSTPGRLTIKPQEAA